MSKNETLDEYEVGYGKPPKNRQFQKGVSGNPKGRPQKSLDFDHELIRESNSFITITENGRRRRISKRQVVIKQLVKQAMTGSSYAVRTYLPLLQQALENATRLAEQRASDAERYNDPRKLTDEELERIIIAGLEKEEQESGKGHLSNTE